MNEEIQNITISNNEAEAIAYSVYNEIGNYIEQNIIEYVNWFIRKTYGILIQTVNGIEFRKEEYNEKDAYEIINYERGNIQWQK